LKLRAGPPLEGTDAGTLLPCAIASPVELPLGAKVVVMVVPSLMVTLA
jgi:hypothetical protein